MSGVYSCIAGILNFVGKTNIGFGRNRTDLARETRKKHFANKFLFILYMTGTLFIELTFPKVPI